MERVEDIRIWIDKAVALPVIRYHFGRGKSLLRIAAGFFTIRGYSLIRSATDGKKVWLLVGVEEPGEQRARKVMVDQIMHDLRSGRDISRYQAVKDLVDKLERKETVVVDARALNHHAKVYIVDDIVAIVASSNVSQRGFIEAIEAGVVEDNQEAVLKAIQDYDEHFKLARDITADLLAKLMEWLRFRMPWEVYLKTLDVLNVLEDVPKRKDSYRTPVSFQLSIVAMALRQIQNYGGAMVVASTGLGKTIIGTDVAFRLYQSGHIRNVIVIAPKPVHQEWKDRLRSAGIMPEIMTPDIWDRQDAVQVESFLSDVDGDWFFIIDESHDFRNRFKSNDMGGKKKKKQQERLAFQRLVPVINKHKCKVLLLTATPYSTSIDNINNQLWLLPHTTIREKGQLTLFKDDIAGKKAWRIDEAEELRDLEVASVLTTPAVAKHWADHDNGNAYVNFGDERKYFPKVTLFRSDIAPILERDVATLLAIGCFKVEAYKPGHTTLIERLVRVSWGSSPRALEDILKKVISPEGYESNFEKTSFRMSIEEREQHIGPVIKKLEQFSFDDDLKLRQFLAVLRPLLEQGNKVLVFSERHPTVVYLEKAIRHLHPDWPVESTIMQAQDGTYRMKSQKEITDFIARFAPVANKRDAQSSNQISIFLSTDAHGIGINLEDARVVINYDLAWTPIEPAQRAGRILRLWHSPRIVHLYAFVPAIAAETQELLSEENIRPIQLVAQRWATLIARHSWSSQILELPTLTTHSQQDIDLLALPTAKIASSTLYLDEMVSNEDVDADAETSPILTQHVSRYERNKKEARSIPNDIVSAKSYPGKTPRIYVLLRHADETHMVVYDLEQRRIVSYSEYQLLNLIASEPDEEPPFEDMEVVENACDECIQAWLKRHKDIPENEVLRECALYLRPNTYEDSVSGLLDEPEKIL